MKVILLCNLFFTPIHKAGMFTSTNPWRHLVPDYSQSTILQLPCCLFDETMCFVGVNSWLRLILAGFLAETCGWLSSHVYVTGYLGQITWDCFPWLRDKQHILLLLEQNKPDLLVVRKLRRCMQQDQETRTWMWAVSVSLQTAFRLTCGSSQSAECNPAGLLFLLSTSEGSGLICCDMADTTLKTVRRPCRWLIQARKTWWGLAFCVYPCRRLNSEQLCGMTLGRVIRLNHPQWMMLMWNRVEGRPSANPEEVTQHYNRLSSCSSV